MDVDILMGFFKRSHLFQVTTSSHGINPDSGIYETVYSEPIQPSLFTDVVETPSDCEDLYLYAPIYTLPLNLSKSKEVALKVFGSNIREIRELRNGAVWQGYSS